MVTQGPGHMSGMSVRGQHRAQRCRSLATPKGFVGLDRGSVGVGWWRILLSASTIHCNDGLPGGSGHDTLLVPVETEPPDS